MEKKTARAKKSTSAKTSSRKTSRARGIKDQNAYLASLIEHVSDALISIGIDGNILSWNSAAEKMYGWKASEVIGHPSDQFLKTDYLGKTDQHTSLEQVLEASNWEGEVIQHHKDGSPLQVMASVSTVRNEDGEIIGLIGVNRDITERKRIEQTLAANERRFRALIENNADGIALIDAKGAIQYASPAITHILGYDIDEYVGHNAFEFIHPDELQAAQELFGTLLQKTDTSLLTSIREKHKDGSWRWLEGLATNLLAEPGVNAIVVNFRDITERRQVEDELKKQREILQKIFDSSPMMIRFFSPDGRVQLANRAWERIVGWTLKEIQELGLDIYAECYPDPHERQRVLDFITAAKGEWVDFKTRVRDARVIDTSFLNIRMSDGTTLGFGLDITERKKAEQELRESEERFRELADNIEEVFWITEAESKKDVYVSPAYQKVWGRQLIGIDDFIESVVADDRPLVLEMLERQTRGEKTEMEYRVQHADGSVHWVWDRAFPVFDQAGKLVRVAGIAADVTDRKHAEEIIQQHAIELERRVEERTAELTRANRAKNEFLANMSHELRTPLNAILGYSEALLEGVRGPITERQKQAIETISSSGQHLLGLINDILDVSKIEAGKLDFHPVIIDAKEICQASLSFVREMAVKKSVTLEFETLHPASLFTGDPRRMKQILVNLLSNSIKFTPENGRVTLDVRADPVQNQIHFCVADTGIGIAPDDLERLFNPFVQVDTSLTRQYEGSGLGLALVHKLVEIHGGWISVESEVGKGSSFTVTLPWDQKTNTGSASSPVRIKLLSDDDQKKSTDAASGNGLSAGERGTILLAEDKETNVMVIKDYLEYRGYRVVIALNGVEALSKADEFSPDAILMDIQMPEMDGLQAIQHLRSNPRFASTPIIALTAFAMPGDRERCIAAGANEYLSKPISLKTLKQMIERFL